MASVQRETDAVQIPRWSRVIGSRGALAGVLVLAAALRVGHVLALRRLPLFDHLLIDAAVYDAWAQRIASGDWLGQQVFYQDPLYPYALGALYRLVGRDLLVVRLVQAAVGVGTVALTAWLGRRVGGRAVGNLAALFVAAYGPLVFQEAEVEKTVLGVFLFTAALVLALGRSTLQRGVGGVALGLAALTRGNLLVLAPLGIAFFLLDPTRDGDGAAVPARGRRWRSLLQRLGGEAGRGALAFSLGFVAVLAPVTWRNHHVSGEWILTTAQAGQNFYIGNNPSNETGAFALVPFVRSHPAFLEADFTAAAEARTGRRMTPSEVSSFWMAEGWAHIRQRPGFAATVTLRKALLLTADLEMPDAWDMYFVERLSPALALPLLGFGIVLGLAVLGAVARFRESREVRALVVALAAYGATLVAFFVVSRYRLPIVPALAALSATGVLWLVERVRRREWRRVPAALLAGGLAAAVSFVVIRPAEPKENVSSYVNLARLYARTGELAASERLFTEALERYREQPAILLCGLGRVQLESERPGAAIASFERCLRADPGHPDAWYLLGRALAAAGDPAAAARALEQQIALIPGHVEATLWLAELEVRGGGASRAADRLAGLFARRSGDPRIGVALAVAIHAAGRPDEARALLASLGASREDFAREYARVTGRAP